MPELLGFDELRGKLDKLGADASKDYGQSVLVGFSAAYAWFVHENLQASHPVGKAKFLESPAREKATEIGRVYADARRQGSSHLQALLLAGLFLQRLSQQECPVDTGLLRNSAETYAEGSAGMAKG